MQPELEETIYVDFIASLPTTGAAADADALPACEVFEDASDTAILTPTVTKRVGKTGNYRVPLACTAANGFEAGKSYNAIVTATVGGVVAKMVLRTFQMRTNGPDDLAASVLTRATPAQVQTELGTYGALRPTVAARTLDVTATGEAGIDWANIGAPTTTQALSATTIATVTSLTNDPPGVTTLLTRVTSTLFTGITSLKEWLGLLAGKQSGNATARTEIRSSGAGSGTFDETTDSQEAIRDRGDVSWITGAGGDPWATAVPGAYAAGTAGNILGSRLDVAVSSRATPAQVQTELGTYGALRPTVAARTLDVSAGGEAGIDWANVGAPTTAQNLSATTIATSQPVASVTNPVTLTSAYDPAKTAAQAGAAMTLTAGERTTTAAVIWNTLTSALTTVGSVGKLIVDNLNATISSAVGDTPGTTTLLSRIASALTITAGKVDVNDKTNFSLTAAYDPAKTAAQAGSAMTLTAAYDAAKTAAAPGAAMTLTAAYDSAKTASTQASVNTIGSYVDTEVGAIKTVTDKLDTALEIDGAVWRYTVNALEQSPTGGTGGGGTDWTAPEREQIRHRLGIDGTATAPAADPSLAMPGDAMVLTAGERNTLAGVIWNMLTSALTNAGSIGKLLVDNLNATVASRSTYAGADTAGTTTLLSRIASALTITGGKVDVNDKTGFSLTAAYDPAKTAMQAGATVALTPAYDAAKTAAPVGAAMTLTAAYDAAKTAASQASVNTIDDFVDTEVGAIKAVTDKLDTALEADGAVYRYTANALEEAPAGGGGAGGTDWTSQERDQIRHRLGIDGAVAVPIAGIPSLASQVSSDAIKIVTDKLNTTLQPDGPVHQFTANALELAPVGTGGNGNGGGPVTQENPCAQNPAQTRGPTTEPFRVVSYRKV